MALNAKEVQGGQKERVAQEDLVGTYPARLVQLIDLGMQKQRAFEGEDKAPAQEIMFTYELVDTFMKDEDGKELEDKPRWTSETMPLRNLKADLAKSTKRYKAFDPDEVFGGDFSKAVGEAVNVTLVTNVKAGKSYTNVAAVTAMRQKDKDRCPELKNPTAIFDFDNPDMEVFNKLPDWIRKKITEGLTYENSPLQKQLKGDKAVDAGKKDAPPKKEKPLEVPNVDQGDDNPY